MISIPISAFLRLLTPSEYRVRMCAADFSIVIPCFNIEERVHVLREALGSVLNQTHSNYEIIVVDDGSSDSSFALIEHEVTRIKEMGVEICAVGLEVNGGTSLARNAGIERARSEYVAFLDFDDVYLPRFLECVLKAFQGDGDRKVVLSPAYFYKYYLGMERVHAGPVPTDINLMPESELFSYLLKANFPVPMGSSIVCRRDIFVEDTGLRFDSFLSKRTAEDVQFGYCLLRSGIRPFFLAQPLVVHRSYLSFFSRGYSAFLNCNELEVYDYMRETSMLPVVDKLRSGSPKLAEDIVKALDRKREYFKVKSFFIEKQYMAGVAYVLKQPRLFKSWFNFLMLSLSRVFPFSILRTLYGFFKSESSVEARTEVISLLRALK